jgi:Na+-translocating ferredoxin:NAD+ oxidoreductase RnfG subunit
VKEWYKAKKAHIKKFVPKDYQHFQLKTIEKEYKENLARIATKNNSTNSKNAAPTTVPPTTAQALPASPIEFFAAMPPMILAEVTSCSTDTCVKEWYKANEADVKKFVPKDYQHFQLKALEKEYNKNLARIATKNNSTNGLSTSDDLAKVPDALAAKLAIVPPMLLAQVSACTTKQCVENWHDKTEAEIESVVPKDYQHFASASIQKAYKKNLARVAQANASNSTNSTGAFLAATKATPQSFSAFLFVAIALFALVPGFFVLRLRARQRKIDLEEDVLRYSPMLDA